MLEVREGREHTDVETVHGILERIAEEMLQEEVRIEIQAADENGPGRCLIRIVEQCREFVEHDGQVSSSP